MRVEQILFFSLVVIFVLHLVINNQIKNFDNDKVKKLTTELGDFPRPQISYGYENLSGDDLQKPLVSDNNITDNKSINIIRSSNLNNDKNPIYYEPELLETDFMAANPIGSTEYKFSEFNDGETSYAWTDENISQHPTFYRSNFLDEKTNPGDFLDKNNKFHDKTSPYSTNNLPDRCFLNKDNEIVCNFNDRLQNIPPSLIEDKSKNYILNNIGVVGTQNELFKDIDVSKIENVGGNNYLSLYYKDEKEMNGGEVFKGVGPCNRGENTCMTVKSFQSNVAI